MKLEDIKIKGWGMVSHMSMDKEHLSKYQGTFECEGFLSEKIVVRESSVKKKTNTVIFLIKAKKKICGIFQAVSFL